MTGLIDTPDVRTTSDIVRSGSYDPATTTAGGFNAECARLEAQAELTFQAELPVLLALRAGGRFLEIGAGSGAVTSRLRVAFPTADLYAVDINPALLQRCNAADVRLVADAAHLPYQEGFFDTVLLRYVLQHLDDPATVLAETSRVLKPEGRVIITDVDDQLWGMANPQFPELAAIHRQLAVAQAGRGGDRTIARNLTRMLRTAGFAEVAMTTFSTTNDARPTADFAPHLGPGRLAPLVESGEISFGQFALVVDRWNRFKNDPDAWVMLIGYTAFGTKTALPAVHPTPRDR